MRPTIVGLVLFLTLTAFLSVPAGGESRVREQLRSAAVFTGGSSVLIADAHGAETIRPPQIRGSAWSRVRRRMAFVDGGFLWTQRADGTGLRRGDAVAADRVVWDPRGRFLLAILADVTGGTRPRISIASPSGLRVRELFAGTPVGESQSSEAKPEFDATVRDDGTVLALERTSSLIGPLVENRHRLVHLDRRGHRLAPLPIDRRCALPWVTRAGLRVRACVDRAGSNVLVCAVGATCRSLAGLRPDGRDLGYVSAIDLSHDGRAIRIIGLGAFRIADGARISIRLGREPWWDDPARAPRQPPSSSGVFDAKLTASGELTAFLIGSPGRMRPVLVVRQRGRRVRSTATNRGAISFLTDHSLGVGPSFGPIQVYSTDPLRLLAAADAVYPSPDGSQILLDDGDLVTAADGARRNLTAPLIDALWLDPSTVLAATEAGLRRIDTSTGDSRALGGETVVSSLDRQPGGWVLASDGRTAVVLNPDALEQRASLLPGQTVGLVTPDGASIVVARPSTTIDGSDILIAPLGMPAAERLLASQPGFLQLKTITPDGSFLVVGESNNAMHGEDGRSRLLIYDLRRSDLQQPIATAYYRQVSLTDRAGAMLVIDENHRVGLVEIATGRFTAIGSGYHADWVGGDRREP